MYLRARQIQPSNGNDTVTSANLYPVFKKEVTYNIYKKVLANGSSTVLATSKYEVTYPEATAQKTLSDIFNNAKNASGNFSASSMTGTTEQISGYYVFSGWNVYTNGNDISTKKFVTTQDMNTITEKYDSSTARIETFYTEKLDYDLGNGVNMPTTLMTIDAGDIYIANYEVTQGEWKAVVNNDWDPTRAGKITGANQGDRKPIIYVTWYDAVIYCNLLTSKLLGDSQRVYYIEDGNGNKEYDYTKWGTIPTPRERIWTKSPDERLHDVIKCDTNRKGFRLPTESEWMEVAHGGKKDENGNYKYPSYSGSSVAVRLDNTTVGAQTVHRDDEAKANAALALISVTKAGNNGSEPALADVGSKSNNNSSPVQDMTGNVWEWCFESTTNKGVKTKSACGGALGADAGQSLIDRPNRGTPADVRSADFGFRVVRSK